MPAAEKKLFYGWKLGFLAMLGNLLIQGGAVYLMNVFTQPFSTLYGWSRGDVTLALGIGSFCGMAASPLLASLAMRIGLRPLMLGGAVLGSVNLFLLGWFDELWLFTVNLCLLWITSQACGGVIANALMSKWFVTHRGKAFGLVNFGTSFSGAILPFTALLLINEFSVRTATTVLGTAAFLILVPASFILIRDTPQEMGLEPDGDTPLPIHKMPETGQPEISKPAVPHTSPSMRELLSSPLMYRIGISFTLIILAGAGVTGQLKPRFSDLGYGDFAATAFMSLTCVFVASGKYIWGWVCDKLTALRTARVMYVFCFFSFLLAFLPANPVTVALFAVICGIAVGGGWTILAAVVAEVYGGKNFVAAYRVITFFLFFKSLGFILMGQVYELTGSYDAAFGIFCGIAVLGFLLTPKTGTRYIAAKD
ncbi:MAG: hypothetical protein DELT_01280 [Desulfovibrio sp.]